MSRPKILETISPVATFAGSRLVTTIAVSSHNENTIVLDPSVNINEGVPDSLINFTAPCDSTGITALNFNNKDYTFVDALGSGIPEEGGVFAKDSLVTVNLDHASLKAYIQNSANRSDTSSMGFWQPNEAVSVGDVRYLNGRENAGVILECIKAGTTGTEQPVVENDNIVANYTTNDRIGHMRLIFNLAEKDEDEVIALGVIYNRVTYSELWNFVQTRPNLVISEEEWQTKFAETNGKFVPYYSSGNGTTTFRTPLLSAYIKGTDSVDNVGSYLEAGLPNIEGKFGWTVSSGDEETAGAFEIHFTSEHGSNVVSNSNAKYRKYSFDASRSNPIYGNSDSVQPESMTGVWVIKAFGIITNNEGTDIISIANRVEKLEAGAISVGFEYFSTNPNIPDGSIPLLGGEYSRTTYKDLWEWVQTQEGYLLEESEWQAKSAENEGNVPFYSKGNGSTTFRVPSLKCWIKGANGIEEVGSFLSAGLPNITGSFIGATGTVSSMPTGAFKRVGKEDSGVSPSGSNHEFRKYSFDASLSSSIYGNSDTVQPKSIVGMWLVKAYGTVTNVGSTDVADIAQGLTEAETRIGQLENHGAGATVVESYNDGTNWYRKWSDGWLEQYYFCSTQIGANSTVTINLILPFKNTNYSIFCTTVSAGNVGHIQVSGLTTSTFRAYQYNTGSNTVTGFYVYACGMGA